MLSALPARLRTDDTQAYIRMDCKGGNPVSAPGVGGNGLRKKIIVAHTLKWPSGLVCLVTCFKKKFFLNNTKILELLENWVLFTKSGHQSIGLAKHSFVDFFFSMIFFGYEPAINE